MSLQKEIDAKRKEIHADGYPMSIGELASIYESKELDIHPEFQRFFRWTLLQKTKLIESILLGIPIPSIFVSQRDDGVWDVVDGVQRLSTIFEFMGILRDENGRTLPPSALEATEYLPALKGKAWERTGEGASSFTPAQRILLKREKLDIKIIKRESDPGTKFELFQRLNTLGTSLSAQEVRNCLLIMMKRSVWEWLTELSNDAEFRQCVALSERQLEERYDMELVLRFIAYKRASGAELRSMPDVGEYLTQRMKEYASGGVPLQDEAATFRATFKLLASTLGEDCFRRYDADQDRFVGPFLVSAFEVVAPAVGGAIAYWSAGSRKKALASKIKALWRNRSFRQNSGMGVSGKRRAGALVPLGRTLFAGR